MRTYRLYDFANPISVAITNPSQSGYSRFVGLEHYDSGELVVKRYSGTELLTTTAKAFEKNDILIARRNVYLKRAGIVFFDGITSGDSIVLRIKEDCKSITGVPKELAQRIVPIVLNSEQFWKYANKHADGMNSKRISKEMLLAYEFELPSLEEQRVLADKLWAAYEVKESYKNLLAQTDKLLHAQFYKMFGDETSRLKIKDVLDESFAGEWGKEDLNNNGVRVLRTTNFMNDGSLDYANIVTRLIDEDKVNKKKLLRGDIILERSGGTSDNPVGRVVYFGSDGLYLCNNFTQVLRCKKSIHSRYLFYNLYYYYQDNKSEVRSMGSQTTGIQNLSLTKYYEVEIPIPPMEKQLEFVHIAEQAEQTKATLNKGIAAIEAVIRSLIAEGTTKI